MSNEPRIHPIVNYWVHHGIRHGEPVKRQEQILHVSFTDDFFVVVSVDEIKVIRQPTDHEYSDYNGKHFNYLKNKYNTIRLYFKVLINKNNNNTSINRQI